MRPAYKKKKEYTKDNQNKAICPTWEKSKTVTPKGPKNLHSTYYDTQRSMSSLNHHTNFENGENKLMCLKSFKFLSFNIQYYKELAKSNNLKVGLQQNTIK